MDGHWKFVGGRGSLKAKKSKAKYKAELGFPGGRGRGAKQKTFHGVGMDIFWNCTMLHEVVHTYSDCMCG